ncbi:hypothetical protein RKD39_002548 [Streptomyces albogriseolus]
MRQPTSRATTASTSRVSAVCTMSARVRPVSTAPRAIGRERKRSMSPLCMSSAMPAPAPAVAKVTVWAKMPAIRNSR